MRVALTNDDGIHAIGLRAFYRALQEAGHEVHVFAPMTEQSAVGHAITVLNPLRAKRVEEQDFTGYGVYGTPADCVKLGIGELIPKLLTLLFPASTPGPTSARTSFTPELWLPPRKRPISDFPP